MKDFQKTSPRTTQKVIRDESDRTYFHQVHEDVTKLYDRNKRIRLEGLMVRGQKLPAFGDDVAFSFSMPENWRHYLKTNYPDVLDQLLSRDVEDNIKGARRLALLEPNWVTVAGNW